MAPRQVIVKVMTVNRPANHVFDFFSDVKNMEIGGAIKSVTKGDNDGRNNMQFSKRTNSPCSGITSYDEYYVGFRIGCTSTGNTIDVCENATDKGDIETGSTRSAWDDTCYASGYKAGQNGPFGRETYDHCGDKDNGDDAYYNGFINGCIEVDNTRDVCISATDA
jgi:hypothetical protein